MGAGDIEENFAPRDGHKSLSGRVEWKPLHGDFWSCSVRERHFYGIRKGTEIDGWDKKCVLPRGRGRKKALK